MKFEKKDLIKVAEINTGNSIPVNDKQKFFMGASEGLPYIGTKDVSYNGDIDYNNGVRIPDKFKKKFKISKKNSSILCIEGGSAGRKLAFNNHDCHYVNKLCSITPLENISPKYLYYYLMGDEFKDQFHDVLHGLIGGVSVGKLRKFKITYPKNINDQNLIVKNIENIYENIDQQINLLNKKITNIDLFYNQYLNKIFISGKNNWKKEQLSDLSKEIFAGGDVDKKNMSKYRSEKFKIPIFTNGEKNQGLYGYTNYSRVNESSITISARGTIGYTQIRNEPYYPAVRLIVVIPNTQSINIDFLFLALQTLNFTDGGSSIPQLTVPKIKNYIIKFPSSIDEQKELVNKVQTIKNKVEEYKKIIFDQIDKYKLLKEISLKHLTKH